MPTKPVRLQTPEEHARNLIKQRANARRYREETKRQTIEAYGGKCACCGEDDPAFLCVDHIDGGGRQERNKWAAFGSLQLYRDLRRRSWPEGYQLLCANCNMAKETVSGCPHQRKANG